MTPLVKISDKLYGKLETYSPTGSVKDRMISYVINKAIQNNKLGMTPGEVLCEATSGNTGIALSAAAAKLGLKCVIFMPSNMSDERKQMMRIYGATIIEAPPDDFEEAIRMRNEFLDKNTHAWSPLQFSNPTNIECHEKITAPEINSQVLALGKKWSAFIHGSGTGGTIEGVRRYCLQALPDTQIVMTIPAESPHGIQGIGDGRDFLADPDMMNCVIEIKTQDAIARAKEFAKSTGLLVGISSGANILASESWIASNNPTGAVITMLCDRGERYLSIFNKCGKQV
ncbi:cysteine synthase family protein [bacterium]|nr:cysteine synthase family protein [bacterium]